MTQLHVYILFPEKFVDDVNPYLSSWTKTATMNLKPVAQNTIPMDIVFNDVPQNASYPDLDSLMTCG